MSSVTRVVVVGAGIIGASCAYYAARSGLDVTVIDRGGVAGGTTGAGEGNLLVSDKGPGPELELALRSLDLWVELGAELGTASFELEHKGGLVVASSDAAMTALQEFAATQHDAGVACENVSPRELAELEPWIAEDVAGGVLYPADAQVQPGLAAARLLEAAVALGADLRLGEECVALRTAGGSVQAVITRSGVIETGFVVNAGGPWAGALADLWDLPLPIHPRRGFVLVTEPLPPVIRHKVYSADYVANVTSGSEELETSTVVEGTPSGTVLIGASRERVGFSDEWDPGVVQRLAERAVALFPPLARVGLMRTYHGFRPYCPDHLPVVGLDSRMQGVLHASGHEGAGIVLAPATGELVTQLITDEQPAGYAGALSPDRLTLVAS